jgi:hypothetical protein
VALPAQGAPIHAQTRRLPNGPTLAYGDTFARGAFQCHSLITGMRCSNATGHGFLINRAGQSLGGSATQLATQAAAVRGFMSPSGNIRCEYVTTTSISFVVCETLNDGKTVALGSSSNPVRLAAGTTVPANRVLPYGSMWKRAGITCVSQTEGVICDNPIGASFAINRTTLQLTRATTATSPSPPPTGPATPGGGYPVVCADGTISYAGGIQGACSHHGGEAANTPTPSATPPGNFIPYPGNGGGPTPCNDGTYSHSSGPGTCSHHGGEAP